MHHIGGGAKLYPLPDWPKNVGSIIQRTSDTMAVTAQIVAEPNAHGTWKCSEMQVVIPCKSMMYDLTPKSKVPAVTMIVGTPEWNSLVQQFQNSADATKTPIQQ